MGTFGGDDGNYPKAPSTMLLHIKRRHTYIPYTAAYALWVVLLNILYVTTTTTVLSGLVREVMQAFYHQQ